MKSSVSQQQRQAVACRDVIGVLSMMVFYPVVVTMTVVSYLNMLAMANQ